MHNRVVVVILAICFSSASLGYIVDGSRISRPRALSYATTKLENKGVIQQAFGATYLRVSDDYLRELLQQIQTPGYKMPNSSQNFVFNEQEVKTITHLKELGQTVHFKPLGFYTIIEDDFEYFMLAIDAPELSAIRKKYGLSEKLDDHAFKIAIGVRRLEMHREDGSTAPAG